MKTTQKKKGFTLIELVIVILIIGILAVVLVPQLSSMVNKAKTSGVNMDFREFQLAAQTVAYENSGFPDATTDQGAALIKALNANLDKENKIDEGSKESTNTDPWNKKYTVNTDTANTVVFTSNGPDGQASTADDLTTTVEYTADGSVKVTTTGFALDKEA